MKKRVVSSWKASGAAAAEAEQGPFLFTSPGMD